MKHKLQSLPDFEGTRAIYFVGIKGVGVAPLALIAHDAGLFVAGSDIDEVFITDKSLSESVIKVHNGFEPEKIEEFFSKHKKSECLIVTTGAHKGFDNPQVIKAKELGIKVITQGQALAVFMKGSIFEREDLQGIAIAGSHGKTTISSLLAVTLDSLGQNPSFAIGTGEVFPIGSPGRLSSGIYFVAEADEYASEPVYDRVPKFLYLNPKYAIFNNIDFDHPDLFKDITEIEDAFSQLAHNICSGGTLIINGDDERLTRIGNSINKDIRVIRVGQKKGNNYVILKIHEDGGTSRFVVQKNGQELGFFELMVPGKHNAINALAVIALLSELGFEAEKIRQALKVFIGSKRRLEVVGLTSGGALIIDDYGHHPLEISTSIKAIRESYPDKKIICIFQPHTYSRTKALLVDFAKSFEGVTKLFLLPIFKSLRDTENDTITIDEYLGPFKEKNDIEYMEKFTDMVECVMQNYDTPEYLILTIGAGDVYKIGYSLKI